MIAPAETLPTWDLTAAYPSLDSPAFAAAFSAAVEGIAALAARFDELGVAQRDPAPLDDATVAAVEEILARYNALLEPLETLRAYLYGLVTADTRDAAAQARNSALQPALAQLTQLNARLAAWLGSLDADALLVRSPHAREHAYLVQRSQIRAAHQMSPAEEALAAELNVSAGHAWGELHANVLSQLGVPFERDGETRNLPLSALTNLQYEPDRDLRRHSFEAVVTTLQANAVPLAAALNSIKGQVNTLATRRGWHSALDAALFDASIDRATLDALLGAAAETFPALQSFHRAKARLLGLDSLAWYDRFAPIGAGSRAWSFAESQEFVVEQLAAYSQPLSDFVARAFRERWIDAGPRDGKIGGAYCMPLVGDQSRVLANFTPSYRGMSMLAHELGHGYHNTQLARRTMLQRDVPMTLAETASIFCETLIRNAALREAAPGDRLEILNAWLAEASLLVVNVGGTFRFEQRLFERRRARELSVDELNALMLECWRETYGDSVAPATHFAQQWAYLPHLYSPDLSFYNFPYLFGLLFGLGLYARYTQDPDAFRAGYNELLSLAGMSDAATLAARFGIDVRTPDFWRASLDVIRADAATFEALVAERTAP